MNEINFYKKFRFNIYKFQKYKFTDNAKVPVQCHFFGRLIKGTAKIKTATTELLLQPGEIFYIPKGLRYQSHWFGENGGEVSFYSFGFEISPIDKPFVLQKIQPTQKTAELFAQLCKDIPFSGKGIGTLYYFFEEIADSMEVSEVPFIHPTIDKAIAAINENPNRKISETAALCNVSESGMYLLFKKYLRKTPNDIRLDILTEKAIGLLSTTNRSVQEISDSLGFSSTSYFRKILQSRTGKTPLEIRKESTFRI